jgi:hypothetical protein
MNQTLRNFETRIDELTAIFGCPRRAEEVFSDFEAADTSVLQGLLKALVPGSAAIETKQVTID